MSAYSDRIVADGASNYWRLNDTGTSAVDVVGGKTGTISGGVTLGQPGALDGDTAMVFDGVTGKIVTPATVAILTPCTIEAWVRGTSSTERPYFCTPYSGSSEEWALLHSTGGLPYALLATAGQAQSQSIFGTGNLADGQWHHVVWTFQSATVSCFVDGVLNKTVATVWALVGMTLVCEMGYRSDGNMFFPGSLDDVAIYPRALTPAEIAAHFTLGTTPLVARLLPRDYNTELMGYLIGVTP